MKNIAYFESNIRVAQMDLIDTLKIVLECWKNDEAVTDLYDIEYEEDEDFFNDDVDETNYDPYLGCDFYECEYENDWGW